MGLERTRPRRLSEWRAFLGMLYRHLRRRDILVESGQVYITDVGFCIARMKACPVGRALGGDASGERGGKGLRGCDTGNVNYWPGHLRMRPGNWAARA